MSQGGNTVEVPRNMTVGDSGKYNTGGVIRGVQPIEDYLDENFTAAKGMGGIQRYRFGEGDMKYFQFHHEQLPPFNHNATYALLRSRQGQGVGTATLEEKL